VGFGAIGVLRRAAPDERAAAGGAPLPARDSCTSRRPCASSRARAGTRRAYGTTRVSAAAGAAAEPSAAAPGACAEEQRAPARRVAGRIESEGGAVAGSGGAVGGVPANLRRPAL
jgi:hypothetical protein